MRTSRNAVTIGVRNDVRLAFGAGGARNTSVIEAKNVSKMYARGVYALHDLKLSIGKGEFVFLTGPSGAGKSTLLRLLLRQEAPNAGQLIVNGRSLSKMNAGQVQAYRRTVGFVFQDFKLIPTRTVYENITFVPRVLGQPIAIQRRKAFQVLKWVGLQHRMNAFPLELSGGEQQRVAVARALINDPRTGAGRRADRESRSGSGARHHEPVSRYQRPRHDGAGRDARSRTDSSRRAAAPSPSSRAGSSRGQ